MNPRSISARGLARLLRDKPPPLVLDARHTDSFQRTPVGIPGSIPIFMDEQPPTIPNVPRGSTFVVYCNCNGQASSTRVAQWLLGAGYTDVNVLVGGWAAWLAETGDSAPINFDERRRVSGWSTVQHLSHGGSIAEAAFLKGLTLPAKRELAVLFVDMVDSTQLFSRHSAEQVLALVQSFMQIVVDAAVSHCGDVHDFEGDGALLYFAAPADAVAAALTMREALARLRSTQTELPLARYAIDSGPLVIGHVGGRERRGLSFIGTAVNTAARLLKVAPTEGIVTTRAVIAALTASADDRVQRFKLLPSAVSLKGFSEPVAAYCLTAESEYHSAPQNSKSDESFDRSTS